LDCPNECQTPLRRKDLNQHIQNECRFTPIPCPFARLGCEEGEALVRETFQQHMQEKLQLHLLLGVGKIEKQDKEIAALKEELKNRPAKFRHCKLPELPQIPIAQIADCAASHLSQVRDFALDRFGNVNESLNSVVSTARARMERLTNGQWILLWICLFAFWKLPCFVKAVALTFGLFRVYFQQVAPRIRGTMLAWQMAMTLFYIYIGIGFMRTFC